MTALFTAALGLLTVAGLVDLTAGVSRRRVRPLPYLAAMLACALLAAVGAVAVAGHPARIELGTFLGFGHAALRVDRLSGLFLVLSFAVAAPVCLACAGWAGPPGRVRTRGLGAACALTLGAVAVVLTADNAFCFLFGWEGLTAGFYLLAGHDRQRAGRADASIITAVFGKASGAFLLVGFLLLATRAGTFSLPSLAGLPPSTSRDVAFGLLVAGFAVKVGIVPMHGWMPRGYRAAPGPLRAIMAAVAVNAGFYGMWRTLSLLHTPPTWLVVTVLLLAGVTAFLGIAHTTVRTDLAEVIAYSSVENGGLITVGYGVALAGAALHLPRLTAVGLLAGTLQMAAHALAKALLFTATAGIESATGTTTLDRLRGIGHRLPYSGTGLAVGALTLAGLPLTVGFVSEWFLLESLMQQFRVGRLAYSLPMAAAGALVALAAGFASVAFVRIVGLVVLAPHRSDPLSVGPDVGTGGRIAVGLLSAGCLAVAAVTPLEARMIAAGLDPVVSRATTDGALKSAWVLQPVYPGFSILSPSWLWVAMPALFAGTVALCSIVAGRRMLAVRRTPAWRSASGGVRGEDQYTPFGFANPTRKVLAGILMTRTELTTVERDAGGAEDNPGRDPAGIRLGYTSGVVDAVERLCYRPLAGVLLGIVGMAQRLQNGRLDAYIAYMLVTVVAVLALVTVLA